MWKRLTVEDLQQTLSYDEFQKLNDMSLSANVSAICQTIIDSTADMFRGAFAAKGYNIDVREHYMSQYYALPVLNYARYQIWTRFPNSENIALDGPRKLGYEEAKELLKEPYLATEKPDYSNDPELSGRTDLTSQADSSLTIPWLRIPPKFGNFGFPSVYWGQITSLSCL